MTSDADERIDRAAQRTPVHRVIPSARPARCSSAVNCARVAHLRRTRIRQGDLDVVGDHGRTLAEHHDDIREIDGFADAVGHEQHGRLGLGANVEQQVLHFHAGELVQRAEGFVHQEKLRAMDQARGTARPAAASRRRAAPDMRFRSPAGRPRIAAPWRGQTRLGRSRGGSPWEKARS